MKRKIFSILFALVLVVSLSLVTAVPVAASPAILEVNGPPTKLTTDAGHYLGSFSPDGSKIVFTGAGGIWVMNANGSNPNLIYASGTRPKWGPDGLIALATGNGIDIIEPNGTFVKNINTSHIYGALTITGTNNVDWSPDGSKIAFADTAGTMNIWIINYDGTGLTQLGDYTASEYSPAWSPDGQWIAFTSKHGGQAQFQVFKSKADGTQNYVPLTSTGGDYPDWGANGKIAYHDGTNALHVMNGDGTGDTVVFAGPAAMVAWSPNGKRIVYIDGFANKNIWTRGYPYTTIQAAITAANPAGGDTIIVAAGKYVEAVLILGKPLTLQGEPGAVIKPDASTLKYDCFKGVGIDSDRRAGIYIYQVNGVIIDGFEIDGTGTDVHYGIIGKYSDGSIVRNCVVHDIVNEIGPPVSDIGGVGIMFYNEAKAGWPGGAHEILIERNVVYKTGRMGIFLGGWTGDWLLSSNNVIKDNNEVYDTWQGPTSGSGGAVTILGASNSLIQGNSIYNNTGLDQSGISILGWDSDPNSIIENDIYNNYVGIKVSGGVVEVHYNNIMGNTYGVKNMGVDMVAAENNWWGKVNGPTHAGNTFNVGEQGNAVSDGVNFVPWLNAAYDIGVSFAPVENTDTGEQFSSIQAAIDDADTDANDTILVAAGQYNENVAIGKRLTLQGAGSGDNPANDTIITPPSGNGIDICLPVGSPTVPTLVIQHLRVAGADKDGIQITDSDGDNNQGNWTLNDVACVGNGVSGYGMGVDLNLNPAAYAHDVTVTDCIFSNNNNFGFKINHGAGSVKIAITGGAMNDNEDGLQALCHPGHTREISVDGVTFKGNTAVGVDFGAKDDYCFNDGVVNLQDLIVVDNGIGMRFKGEGVASSYGPGYLLPAGSISVSNVDITGSTTTGVLIQNYSELDNMGLHYNNIDGNTMGLDNQCADTVDAKYNWWGKASGPGRKLPHGKWVGKGDKVSDNVDYMPWLHKSKEDVVPEKMPSYAQSVVLDKTGAYGWNTFSTPIFLDDEADTWKKLYDLTDLEYSVAYRFDSDIQEFVLLTTDDEYAIKPGEGFFIKMDDVGSLSILYSTEENLIPPSRPLTEGWNLIGLASLKDMNVEDALASLATVPGLAGYSQVVSPIGNSEPGPVLADGTIYVGESYWVYMLGARTLAGFTMTPVDWMP